MADSKPSICANEKDHLSPLGPRTDAWYREAVVLAKPDALRSREHTVDLYSRAAEHGHWKAMHNLANPYRTGRPEGVEKDAQKVLDLYQKMIDLEVPRGFYDMRAMISNRAGVMNPVTDGLNFLNKAVSLGDSPALIELGKLYIYVVKKEDLGLVYTHCAVNQGYAPASYELGAYYRIVEHDFLKALGYYQASVSQGRRSAALFISGIFDRASSNVDRMWYAPDGKLRKLYDGIYDELAADPDFRFPNLVKDHPLPSHPTQGYDVDRSDRRPGQ